MKHIFFLKKIVGGVEFWVMTLFLFLFSLLTFCYNLEIFLAYIHVAFPFCLFVRNFFLFVLCKYVSLSHSGRCSIHCVQLKVGLEHEICCKSLCCPNGYFTNHWTQWHKQYDGCITQQCELPCIVCTFHLGCEQP